MYKLADQVGSLNPGEYITPKLMFPSHTLLGRSWHSFILGRIWEAIRGLGEVFSTIFGLLLVGRLIWYGVKVLMNCSYIHSVAWLFSQACMVFFCTEVFFTRNYRRDQRQQGPTSERSNNGPSYHPKRTRNYEGSLKKSR